MKKIIILTFLLVVGVTANAQNSNKGKEETTSIEEFFLGKWKLLVEGLPTGDAEMLLVLEKKDGKLEGTLGGIDGGETNKLTKAEIKGSTLNVNFMGGGFDIPIYLDKEKNGTITGSMNDMFDVTGEKISKE